MARTPSTLLHSLIKDDGAAAGIVLTIAGLTITFSGLLAWFFAGSLMVALHNVPEVGGTLAFFGFLALAGVVTVLAIAAKQKWG